MDVKSFIPSVVLGQVIRETKVLWDLNGVRHGLDK